MSADYVTIKNFGEQWTKYPNMSGFAGSHDFFADFISPYKVEAFKDCVVADIGAGTGRFSNIIAEAGAKEIIVLEPSDAMSVAKKSLSKHVCKTKFLKKTADQLPANANLDVAISIGVIHHIPDTKPVINAVFRALKPGGKFIVWVYGKENNRLYLAFMLPLRFFLKRMPWQIKSLFSWAIQLCALSLYIKICKLVPWKLPLKNYMLNIMDKLSLKEQRVIIYDQLNPKYAKYYNRQEAVQLMQQAPFKVDIYPRREYSWVIIGTKNKKK